MSFYDSLDSELTGSDIFAHLDDPWSHDDEAGESYNVGSSDIVEGDGSGIDISILFDTPQVYS